MTARTPEEIARGIANLIVHGSRNPQGAVTMNEFKFNLHADITREVSSALSRERSRADPVAEAAIKVPIDVAKLIDHVYLPTNPNKVRTWAPDVRDAVLAFKRLIEEATR